MKIRRDGYDFDVLIYNNAIVSVRSALTFKNTIGFINDDNHASFDWKGRFFKFKWTKSVVFYWVEWLSCRLLSRVVVNSDYLRNRIITSYHAKPQKVFRLYKGVETPYRYPVRNNPYPVILFVKNDYRRAGLFVLADAMKKLNRKMKIIIVGTPPSADAEITGAFSTPLIECDIQGFLSQQAVYELMATSDIFCVPSLNEAFGVANIEAMRTGCAVITTNVGGIPEVTDHGKCAWEVAPGNVDQLADAIEDCLNNKTTHDMKIRDAYEYAGIFSIEKMFENFLLLLKPYEQVSN